MATDERALNAVTERLNALLAVSKCAVIAIDGRCAAGKTTLAARLKNVFDANVLHMDEFFLRPEQRTAERQNEPGGNVDRERFEAEVLLPLIRGADFSYRPFDCHLQKLCEPVTVTAKRVNIIEGSYSCHPKLIKYYNATVFLNVESAEQLRRIKARAADEGVVRAFVERWIPLEERYFAAFGVERGCEMSFLNQ